MVPLLGLTVFALPVTVHSFLRTKPVAQGAQNSRLPSGVPALAGEEVP